MIPAPPSWHAPAVPLVVHDPYLSVWSASNALTDQWPVHWSGQSRPMAGIAWIDGDAFRFIGRNTPLSEIEIPAMRQTRVSVLPTSTSYVFEAAGVELVVRFTSPALAHDLEVLARPVTYVDCTVRALDGRAHEVSLYLDLAAVWAVAMPEQRVVWGRHRAGEIESLWVGSKDQPVLERAGDEIGIDWGYLHLSAAPGQAGAGAIGEGKTLRTAFARTGRIEARDDVGFGDRLSMPAAAASVTRVNEQGFEEGRPPLVVMAASTATRHVGEQALTSSFLIAYDQAFAVEYFGRRLRPLWYESAGSALGLIERAWADRQSLLERSARFDADLCQEAEASGGTVYAQLVSLAFRQCLGGHALVRDHDGRLLHFSKENSSNGCMGTVDVLYPASPFFLLFNPALVEAQLEPILALASSRAWPFPFAPHDVGRFPLANGQVYGGGMHTAYRQMPVEECGNMLLCTAGLAKVTGSTALAERYWPTLEGWAEYLLEHGLDPAEQLCTDDFAGHLAHNANLSLKAILAVAAFAQLCARRGLNDAVTRYRGAAEGWVRSWLELADDGDHYRLAFDQPGSWSQKYNLVWDRLLGLDLVPADVARKELAFYRTKQNTYGLPLDSRETYTKLDWLIWSGCLTGDRGDFDALVSPLERWLLETPSRVPLSDWFFTDTGATTRERGFRGRTVVGGVFMKLLLNRVSSADDGDHRTEPR
jgi:Domain of unknown function (DUF4965)/Domain of unknown function (DUF1793)/Domain of unknown function (DUF5127)/Domain of unknown function (DUF4964)